MFITFFRLKVLLLSRRIIVVRSSAQVLNNKRSQWRGRHTFSLLLFHHNKHIQPSWKAPGTHWYQDSTPAALWNTCFFVGITQ